MSSKEILEQKEWRVIVKGLCKAASYKAVNELEAYLQKYHSRNEEGKYQPKAELAKIETHIENLKEFKTRILYENQLEEDKELGDSLPVQIMARDIFNVPLAAVEAIRSSNTEYMGIKIKSTKVYMEKQIITMLSPEVLACRMKDEELLADIKAKALERVTWSLRTAKRRQELFFNQVYKEKWTCWHERNWSQVKF